MSFELFQDVVLARDVPEEGLCRGDMATVAERLDPNGGEPGYALELFNSLGQTIKVVIVSESALRQPSADEILAVRPLAQRR